MKLQKIPFLLMGIFFITAIVAEEIGTTESTTELEESTTEQPLTTDDDLDQDAYSYYPNYYNRPYYYNPGYYYNNYRAPRYNYWNQGYNYHWHQPTYNYPRYHRTYWGSRSQYDDGHYRVYRRGSLRHPRPRELFRVGRVIFVNPHGPRNYARPNNPSG